MMICDNEPDVLLLFEHVFRSKYDLVMVGSGEECIERYIEATNQGNKISLILLDYKLEGMWGDTVMMLVKELENGNYISKYIQKPIETDCLTELVAEIIKN